MYTPCRPLRLQLLLEREIPMTNNIDPLTVLATDADVAGWMNEARAVATAAAVWDISAAISCASVCLFSQIQTVHVYRSHHLTSTHNHGTAINASACNSHALRVSRQIVSRWKTPQWSPAALVGLCAGAQAVPQSWCHSGHDGIAVLDA